MKNPIILSLLFSILFALNLQAQDKLSWRKHAKLAEELFNKGQFADAAEHYSAAWKKKTKKKELAYKGGESFYLIRDYRSAAELWKHVKDEYESYPLIGLQYARCLKQNGDYEAASSELVNFLGQYNGSDKSTISEIVQNELRGCELAAQYAVKGMDENIRIEYLTSNINTPEIEFAPMPFGDEALYFSSTMGKRAEIFRSIKSGSVWSKASPIENFPKIEEDHFCNGSLTPDASRFYFTICKSVESWGGLTSQCELFVTRRMGNSWSTPERLPDYLNEVNATTTHPYVIHEGSTEVLYFASNRKGGMGGMDIWYTTREINSNANDFTLPINAGSKVNTFGDEITPYYDQVDDAIYFASNGQISIGGYDIFMAKGAKSHWSKANNMGMPINSSADDFFFVKTTSGKGGFFSSNRTFEMEKLTTTDEDIFAFNFVVKEQRWVAKGEVYSKKTKEILKEVEVALYEMDGDQRRFKDKIVSATGLYNFDVEPDKRYMLEVLKNGFFKKTYEFDTREYAEYDDFGAPVFMEPYYDGYQEEPIAANREANTDLNSNNYSTPSANTNSGTENTVSGNGQKVQVNEPSINYNNSVATTNTTTAPTSYTTTEIVNPENSVNGKTASGGGSTDTIASPKAGKSYFKIQIIALSKFNPNLSMYSSVKGLGKLDTEYIQDRRLYRVMIADYNSASAAKADLGAVRKNRMFRDAFIVEYKDGQRIKAFF